MKFLFSKAAYWTVSVVIVSLFVYGLVKFPSVPIRPCGIQFCSKYGVITTREVFEAFLIWEKALIALFVLVFLHRLAGWLLDKRGMAR